MNASPKNATMSITGKPRKLVTGQVHAKVISTAQLLGFLEAQNVTNGQRKGNVTVSRLTPFAPAFWVRPVTWCVWGQTGRGEVTVWFFTRQPTPAEVAELAGKCQ